MNTKTIQNFINKIILLIMMGLLTACVSNPNTSLVELIFADRDDDQYEDQHESHHESRDEKEISLEMLYDTLGPYARINKVINLCDKDEILYVKMHNHSSLNSDEFSDIVMRTLEENPFFEEVLTRPPTIYINVEPEIYKTLPDDDEIWYDRDDPLTIGQIKHMYPEKGLLILEVRMQGFGEFEPISVSANLIDPKDGSTIVLWHETRSVWYWVGAAPVADVMDDVNDWFENVDAFCDCNCLRN